MTIDKQPRCDARARKTQVERRPGKTALALAVSALVGLGARFAHADPPPPAKAAQERARPAESGRTTPPSKKRRGHAPHDERSQDAPKDEPDGPPPPRESESLAKQARALFDAIAGDTPENALVFFFPREPFLVLKDVKDPGRYHDELVRAFRHDIHELNATRRSWDGARFLGFELGSPPRWIKPGVEWNKLGYYRTFDAKLRYEVSGKQRRLFVHTIISWDGKWYVTHLVRVKH